ncbi:hypothetical protein ACAG39_10925 [Caldicellulosiruptoraceae bacterium PP1]
MRYNFKAEIIRQKDIDGAYIERPFDVKEIFDSKRIMVKGAFLKCTLLKL